MLSKYTVRLKQHSVNKKTNLEVLVITRESFFGTEGAFLELLTNLLIQFLTPSKDENSLRGRRDQGFELFMSSTATANARPTYICKSFRSVLFQQ